MTPHATPAPTPISLNDRLAPAAFWRLHQRVVRWCLLGTLLALVLAGAAGFATTRTTATALMGTEQDHRATAAVSAALPQTPRASLPAQTAAARPGACAAGDAITGNLVWGNEGNGGGPGPLAVYQAACGR